MERKIVVTSWVGGIPTVAGGTRTSIKRARPWQLPMNIDPTTCPFEPERLRVDGREILLTSPGGEWVSFSNLFTPYPEHRLVVPATCTRWSEERLRSLGGEVEICKALELAQALMEKFPQPGMYEIAVNVGWGGGQNYGHLHWHVFGLPPELHPKHNPPELAFWLGTQDSALCIFDNESFQVLVGGHRAGQCFIIPHVPCLPVIAVAKMIDQVVSLYAEKFRAIDGECLPPDFTLGLVYYRGSFSYATYVPILNQWGSVDYLGLLGQQAITLPWPHEITAEYLRTS